MIRSNCWAVLALAAQHSLRRLGTGVNVPAYAPGDGQWHCHHQSAGAGRCFISLGTGHTAMRMLARDRCR